MKRHMAAAVFLLLPLFAMSREGCAEPVPARAASPPETATVVYGGSSWLGHYPVWVGIESGLFRARGLDVRFRQFYASSSRMGAMISGDIDFASTGAISAIALMAAGVRSFYAVGTQDSYATVEGIVAGQGIRSVEDLKGKKLAVTFASSAHVLVLDALLRHGLDPNRDVRLINLKVSEMPAAFGSGEIDACALWTPMFNKVLSMKGAHLLLDDRAFGLYREYGVGPGPDVLVARKGFVDPFPGAARAFLEAYFDAVGLLRQSPRECAKQLVGLTGLSLEEQLLVLRDITWYGPGKQYELMKTPGNFVKGLQKLADFLVTQRQIDEVPGVCEWVNTGLLPAGKAEGRR